MLHVAEAVIARVALVDPRIRKSVARPVSGVYLFILGLRTQ